MDPVARTRLEQLIRSSDQSIREHCDNFNRTAQVHNEPGATLSYRQLTRWIAGEVTYARAASMRVAGLHWGEPFPVLIGPPFTPDEGEPRHPSFRPGDGLSVVRLDWREVSVPGVVTVRVDLGDDGRGHPGGRPRSSGTFALVLARVLIEMGDRVVGLQRAVARLEPSGAAALA
jgi:hypothetical protein